MGGMCDECTCANEDQERILVLENIIKEQQKMLKKKGRPKGTKKNRTKIGLSVAEKTAAWLRKQPNISAAVDNLVERVATNAPTEQDPPFPE